MTVELEERVRRVEARQDGADERFGLILKELMEAKKERTEIKEVVQQLVGGQQELR